tara:strand:- start:2987 stop:4402 length:1416 start_codon:yes stop_codon:yes gene_type:complete
MAQKPLRILDQYGRPIVGTVSGFRQMRALDQWPYQRERIDEQSLDLTRDKFDNARNAGRQLYNDFVVCRGLVREIARFVGTKLTTSYTGNNAEWGGSASDYLERNDRTIDIRGRGYNADRLRLDLVTRLLVDGEIGVLLSRAQTTGTPKVQLILGDYLGTDSKDSMHRNGVLRNSVGTVQAYLVDGEEISVDNLVWLTLSGFEFGGRGLSPLGLSRIEWLDINKFHQYELMAQRLFASRALKVTNASGEAMIPGADAASITAEDDVVYENYEAGGIEYFKSNHDLSAFDWGQRPSQNTQEFFSRMLSWCFYDLGWDIDFSLEQRKTGGASIRVSSDRTRNTARHYFEHVIRRTMERVDGYRLSVASKLEAIPEPPTTDDLFAWSYSGGMLVTADRKYQAQVDQLELENGLTTREEIAANRQQSYPEVRAQRQRELRGDIEDRAALYDEALKLAGGDQAKASFILNSKTNEI